ncbi:MULTISPECIES: Smr/MutS family protein [unclassified Bradyrhizobium]|uniref:Smr/MutS family protein n=1 Tax=unclassified Bradyrhizobium TaxID=2631580 RepID=UPI002FF38C3A
MKRRPPSLIPELPEPPRRQRGLSEEDRALWESVAKQVKPLRKRQRTSKLSAVSTETGSKVAPKPAASPRHVAPARNVAPSKPEPPPLAPIGRRERSHLSRGRKEIDARLDLHGMTQTRAHRALFGFLQRAHHDGLTFVLIITGKGKVGSESERGVLRRQVPQWLALPEFRSLVVGFEEAHIGHGGEGALYVRVRRARI